MDRKIGFLFTGQGSQSEKMGFSLCDQYEEAREVYALLPEHLREMSFSGSLEEISRTEHLQPIMLALQLSVLKILDSKGIKAVAACGLSLGEYSALVAAGAMTAEEALAVIQVRGREMADAAAAIESGMAAVIGMPEEEIEKVVSAVETGSGRVYLSNINSSRQIVISGEKEAVAAAGSLLKEKGAKVLPLNVTGPFHTPYMDKAVPGLAEALRKVDWKKPALDYYTNTTGGILNFAEEEKSIVSERMIENLTRQMTSPVRLYDCLRNMEESGIEEWIEIGPGKVISAIAKKEFPNVKIQNIAYAEDLERYFSG